MRRVAILHRRHPNGLAGAEALVGLAAPTIDAHLTRSDQLLQMPEAEAGEVVLEPAVEAHASLVLCHDDRLDARPAGRSMGHAKALTKWRPATSAANDRTIEPPT